jgi:7-dehydrocholesterol reductase
MGSDTCPLSKYSLNENSSSKDFNPSWGRTDRPGRISTLVITTMFFTAPLICLGFVWTNHHYGGSFKDFYAKKGWQDLYISSEDFWFVGRVLGMWLGWQYVLALLPDLCQLFLPSYVGGKQKGQRTPAGHILTYNVNGLQAWILTHVIFVVGVGSGWLDAAWIIHHWLGVFYWANIFGYTLTFLAYLKAHWFPTHAQDNKVTHSRLFDLVMGVEFNPRLLGIDFKLFFNGRPGIIAWSIINLCCAVYQYEQFGCVTNAMVLLNFLQGLYVVDFFWNERWYLKTMDINHDHFGFYLAWGDCVWLPFMYTLQGLYLAHHDLHLPWGYFFLLLVVGVAGYVLFRWTNYQKDHFRRQMDDGLLSTIWGRPATFIPCSYTTRDGKRRKSFLLTSGFWGWARHMNYTGDIILSATWSLCCGTQHLLPYFYLVYICVLLITRTWRDEKRCRGKYGSQVWDDYCQRVPKRFIPGLF